MRAKEFTKQGLTEGFEEEAQEYKSYLLKTLPQLMRFLKGVRGAPSEKQMLDAIEIAYTVMKRTGDVKQAAKAKKEFLTRMQGVAESASGKTPSGYTWSFEHGGEVPYKSNAEANTFIRVKDGKGKTVLGVWADVNGDDVEVQYSEVFDKKLRGKGIYTDFLKGLSKHYNIISDQDHNNAATGIYKKLGAAYNNKTEKHTLSRPSNGVAEGQDDNGISFQVQKGKNKFATTLSIGNNSVGVYQYDANTGRSIAEVYPEFKGKGLGKLLVLHAIYTAAKLGLDFQEDESRTSEYDNVLDSLSGSGYIVDDEGYWYVTGEGEQFLKQSLKQGVAEDTVDEMALKTYKTMGDFSKPGPFTGADKKLVPHPKNIEKATQFFERTPFDFRLFFSHLKGTGKYSEHGPMSPDQIRQVFGQDAEEIINGSEDAITVVYVGNKGDAKVMLTPWMMAHRFGHAINAGAGVRNKNWTAWGEAEKYFFQTVNSFLEEHYGKVPATKPPGRNILYQLEPEYNALFNAMGTQRSSKSGQIRRPYEFLYELFAQYLGTGKVTLNPLPTNLTYGRRVFGNPTKYMNIKPEFRDAGERQQAADSLAYTMELLFNDVLSDSVGKIFVM